MTWHWGYSPKVEKYIPLGDFPPDKYLVIVRQAIQNLGWNISYCSETGIIAYTGLSWRSYSEEIAVKIHSNFAIVRSECVGIQLCFTDYGKNNDNLEKFFHEFDYVEFHFSNSWQEEINSYHTDVRLSDTDYFERAPLAAKSKITDFVQLFFPTKGYRITPIILTVNVLIFLVTNLIFFISFRYLKDWHVRQEYLAALNRFMNSRADVLSGDYWRLISSVFLHGSVPHLIGNMCALTYIGLMVENKLGWKKYLTIYFLSGIAASATSIIFHPVGFALGASGAIMGMFGAFLALLLSNVFERNAQRALLLSTVLVVALMLLSGIRGRTDNAAHIGGLVSGFVICYLLQARQLNKPYPLGMIGGVSLTSVYLILVLSFLPNYQLKEFSQLKRSYSRNIQQTYGVRIAKYHASRTKKLSIIKEFGINKWRNNTLIVLKMKRLILPDRLKRRVDRMDKVAALELATYWYLYKEAADSTKKYRPAINRLNERINKVYIEDKIDPATKWKSYLN